LLFTAMLGSATSQSRQRKQTRPASTSATQTETAKNEIPALLKIGNIKEAETAARNAIAINPRDPDLHTLLGIVLDQSGNTAEAEKEYRTAAKLDPRSASARVNLGVMLARTNRIPEAIKALEEALTISPNHPQASLNLGLLYGSVGNFERSLPLLERAVNSNRMKSREDLPAMLALTKAYLATRRNKEALRLSEDIQASAGDDPRVLYTLGLQFAEAQQYERAAELFKRTNELRPNTGEVQYNLGVALYNLDRFDEAAPALENAATLLPRDPDPLYRLGLIASAKGNSALALGYWQKVITLREGHADAYFMMAEELAKHQRTTAADYYEKAITYDPSKLLYYVRLGASYFRRRHYQQAREVYERAATKFPDAPEVHYLIGYSSRALGLYDDALASFQRALSLQPDNVDVLANLGFIFGERGDYQQAEKLLRRAIAIDAKHFPANYDLGRLLVRLKRYDEALPILQRGATLSQNDPGIHYQLFMVYSRLKKKAEADRELAVFKRLEEARKRGDAAPEGSAVNEQLSPPVTELRKQ
jgi:Flp pilus assembly protein TadD